MFLQICCKNIIYLNPCLTIKYDTRHLKHHSAYFEIVKYLGRKLQLRTLHAITAVTMDICLNNEQINER